MSTARAPRRLGRPPAAHAVDTRGLLLDVARRLFAQHGYQAATTKQIAEASDITTGAIYHYFGSKQELYEAVFAEVEDTVHSRYASVTDPSWSFAENMAALLAEALEISREDPSVAQFFVEVQTEALRNDELAPLAIEQARRTVKLIAPLVSAGIEQRAFAPDVSERSVTYAVMAVMTGIARFSAAAGDPRVLEEATAVLTRFFAGSIFPDPLDGVA